MNPELDAIMGLAAQQGGGAPQPGAGPPQGGGPPGGMPPGAGGQQQVNPIELLQMSLMGLAKASEMLGTLESAKRATDIMVKAMERLQKGSPQGRQNAGMGQGMGGAQPPGVGPMPGMNMT